MTLSNEFKYDIDTLYLINKAVGLDLSYLGRIKNSEKS